jgi:hypothetical protein
MSGPIDHVFSMLPSRAVDDPGLSDLDVRVLAVFAAHNSNDGWVRGYGSVADVLSRSVRSVRTSSLRLIEKGYLDVRESAQGGTDVDDTLFRVRAAPAPKAAGGRNA